MHWQTRMRCGRYANDRANLSLHFADSTILSGCRYCAKMTVSPRYRMVPPRCFLHPATQNYRLIRSKCEPSLEWDLRQTVPYQHGTTHSRFTRPQSVIAPRTANHACGFSSSLTALSRGRAWAIRMASLASSSSANFSR